jgi:hypothetical protein
LSQSTPKKNGARTQLQNADVVSLGKLRTVLNEILLGIYQRLDALGGAIYVLPTVTFETPGAAPTPALQPFGSASGGLKISCPFTPTGLVLLRLTKVQPPGQPVSTLPSDVKWTYAAGPLGSAGAGSLVIQFVTGLDSSSRYEMIVGVTRAQ